MGIPDTIYCIFTSWATWESPRVHDGLRNSVYSSVRCGRVAPAAEEGVGRPLHSSAADGCGTEARNGEGFPSRCCDGLQQPLPPWEGYQTSPQSYKTTIKRQNKAGSYTSRVAKPPAVPDALPRVAELSGRPDEFPRMSAYRRRAFTHSGNAASTARAVAPLPRASRNTNRNSVHPALKTRSSSSPRCLNIPQATCIPTSMGPTMAVQVQLYESRCGVRSFYKFGVPVGSLDESEVNDTFPCCPNQEPSYDGFTDGYRTHNKLYTVQPQSFNYFISPPLLAREPEESGRLQTDSSSCPLLQNMNQVTGYKIKNLENCSVMRQESQTRRAYLEANIRVCPLPRVTRRMRTNVDSKLQLGKIKSCQFYTVKVIDKIRNLLESHKTYITQTCIAGSENYELIAVESDNYELSAVESESYELSAVEIENYKLCAVENENYELCAVESENYELCAAEGGNCELSAVESEHYDLSAVGSENYELCAVESENTELSAVESEDNELGAIEIENNELSAVESEDYERSVVENEIHEHCAVETESTEHGFVESSCEVPRITPHLNTHPPGPNVDTSSRTLNKVSVVTQQPSSAPPTREDCLITDRQTTLLRPHHHRQTTLLGPQHYRKTTRFRPHHHSKGMRQFYRILSHLQQTQRAWKHLLPASSRQTQRFWKQIVPASRQYNQRLWKNIVSASRQHNQRSWKHIVPASRQQSKRPWKYIVPTSRQHNQRSWKNIVPASRQHNQRSWKHIVPASRQHSQRSWKNIVPASRKHSKRPLKYIAPASRQRNQRSWKNIVPASRQQSKRPWKYIIPASGLYLFTPSTDYRPASHASPTSSTWAEVCAGEGTSGREGQVARGAPQHDTTLNMAASNINNMRKTGLCLPATGDLNLIVFCTETIQRAEERTSVSGQITAAEKVDPVKRREKLRLVSREEMDNPLSWDTGRGRTRRKKGVMWAWVLVLLVAWACGSHASTYSRTGCDFNGTSPLPNKHCGSLRLRNDPRNLLQLCLCVKVVGCLHITSIKGQGDADPSRVLQGFTFPHLREITEYLLIYRVRGLTSLATLFPNLSLIRGTSLFHNYALVMYSLPDLLEVGLPSLTTILRGSVRIERNPALCYANSVDWNAITSYGMGNNVIKRNRAVRECPKCPAACQGPDGCEEPRCWGPQHCQRMGGCVGGECCHPECVGGCYAPGNASACVSCRCVIQGNTCVSSCSSGTFRVGDRCVSLEECRAESARIRTRVECSRSCLIQRTPSNTICDPCQGCVGPCNVTASLRNIQQAEDLQHCTSVDALEISITGGVNVEAEIGILLSNIEEVRGYLRIFKTNLTSTSILPNLTRIRGESLKYNQYSLVVLDNPRLQSLASWTRPDRNFTIDRGKILFQTNPRLCLRQINTLVSHLTQSTAYPLDEESRANGQEGLCEVTSLSVGVRASPIYGTLIVTIDALPAHLMGTVGALYIKYRQTTHNVTLQQDPCSAAEGWSVMEVEWSQEEELEVEVGGLTPNTRYALYVRTHAPLPAREDIRSPILYSTTSDFNPSPPVGVNWASRSSSTLEVWWEPPRRPHGHVDHYMVAALMLPDAHAHPPYPDLCSTHAQKSLSRIWQEKQRRETSSEEAFGRLEEAEEEEEGEEKEEEEKVCKKTSSLTCCACSDNQQEDVEVTDFEEILLQDVNTASLANARHRAFPGWAMDSLAPSSPQHRPGSEDGAQALLAGRNSQENFDQLFQTSLTGGGNYPQLVPLHQYYAIYQPANSSNSSQGTTRLTGRYQLHDSRIFQLQHQPHHDDGAWSVMKAGTYTRHLTLTHLKHSTVYLVGVVACLTPTNCTSTPVNEGVMDCKLCSTVASVIAATTAANVSADVVPEDSLHAHTHNSTVRLDWLPPPTPNGAVLTYHLQYTFMMRQRSVCVSVLEYESGGGGVDVEDLAPGTYTWRVRVRSRAGYGPYTRPASFIVQDRQVVKDGGAVWWVSVVVVVTVVCSVVVMVWWWWWWWWRRSRINSIPSILDQVDVNPFYRGFAPSEMFREEFILWRDDLTVRPQTLLGHGYFGKVLAGELRTAGTVARSVAVKTHSDAASTEEVVQFLREAAVMQDIECHHVVRLLGVVGDYAPVYVVMELMEQGDLRTYLKNHRGDLSNQKVLEMAAEAADGMTYLAWKRLVHRDLAARNCMLDQTLTLKIGDFGLSRSLHSNYYRKEGRAMMPVRWMAPESLQFSVYNSQSDVWSYGVLLWEMTTRGVRPYKNNTNDEVVRLVVEQRLTLPHPLDCPPALLSIMQRCWNYDPASRPSFSVITAFLLKHVSVEYGERFQQVSAFHSLASQTTSRESVRGGSVSSQCLHTASDDDLHNVDPLTITSDLSHDSAPEGEESEWREVPLKGQSPCHSHLSPLQLPAVSAKQHAPSYHTNTEREVECVFPKRPTCKWPLQGHNTTNHVYTNCTSVDFLPQAAPFFTSQSVFDDAIFQRPGLLAKRDTTTFLTTLGCTKQPYTTSDEAQSRSASVFDILSDPPTLNCAPSSISCMNSSTPFPGATVSFEGFSLALQECGTQTSVVQPYQASANLPDTAVHYTSSSSSPEPHSYSSESALSLRGFHDDQFPICESQSCPDTRVLEQTELLCLGPSVPLLSYTSLP
ncbi:insulin-like receptor isoform X2 [Cherax quadricarinatus]|uniref:insulin-like receptor isoform X2 n=1 Tax=Cherax quadricarinatus TaxID=27406 RepID=UPI00387EE6D7